MIMRHEMTLKLYLDQVDLTSDLTPQLPLNKQKSVYFQWDDWSESIEYIKSNRKKLNQILSGPKKFFWLKRKGQQETVRIEKSELLSEAISPFFNRIFLENGDYQYSENRNQKKFHPMNQLFKTFSKELMFLRRFLLINGRGSKRDFRLRTNLGIGISGIGEKNKNGELYQITKNGFLFKFKKSDFKSQNIRKLKNKSKPNQTLTINLPIGIFYNKESTTYQTMIRQISHDDFHTNCLRMHESFDIKVEDIDLQDTPFAPDHFFIFVSFKCFKSIGHGRSVEAHLKSFLEKVEEGFLNELADVDKDIQKVA